jgi:hypothetical protein
VALASPIVADVTGDARPEIISSDHTQVFVWDVDGVPQPGFPVAPRAFRNLNDWLTAGDVDRDGKAEAYSYVTTVGDDPRYIFAPRKGYFVVHDLARGGAPPRQTPPHTLFRAFSNVSPGAIAIGDLDGDGQQELVTGTYGVAACGFEYGPCDDKRSLGIVVQRLDGTLMPHFPKPLPVSVPSHDPDAAPAISITVSIDDPRYNTPAISDLDGDGLKEVVWVDPSSSRIFVWDVPGTPGPVLADWPMYHHDPKHTNALPTR